MEKVVSPEKLAARQAAKEKEIAKLEKEKNRPKKPYYLIYIVFLICLVYIVDEIASNIGAQMKTEIANDLLASYGDRSVGMLDILNTLAMPIMILAMFYKTLSDRYGRKVFIVLNTLGMSLGMLIVFLSNNLIVYLIGALVMQFFVPHDMQVVYIMETAPSQKRATIFSVVRFFTSFSLMLIPLLRRIFMTDISQWRAVYLIPAVLGLVVSFVMLLCARETDAFIEARLVHLRKTEEELAAERAQKDAQAAQGGLGKALKFVWKHKQLRWLFICATTVCFGMLINMYYQVILSYGYAEHYLSAGLFTTLDKALNAAGLGPVTQALFLMPFTSAVVQFANGVIADKWSRKTSAVSLTCVCLLSFMIFSIGCKQAWNASALGLILGISVGAYSGISDLFGIMISESSPTNLRSSIMAAQTIPILMGTGMASVFALPFVTYFGNTAISNVVFCLAVPMLGVTLLALIYKTHDTKGVNLETVTGTEWD